MFTQFGLENPALQHSQSASLHSIVPLFNLTLCLISTDYQGEYYGPGANYDYFPQGPPSSQAQTPGDLGYAPSSGPAGTPLGSLGEHHHPGHHPAGDVPCYTDIISQQHARDSPSPEPSGPASMQSISSEMCGPGTPFTSLSLNGSGYSNQLSHTSSEMSEGTVW